MLVCRVFSYSFNNLNTHQHTHILYSQIAALIASFTFIMFFLFFLLAAISHSLGLPTLTRRRDSPFTLVIVSIETSYLYTLTGSVPSQLAYHPATGTVKRRYTPHISTARHSQKQGPKPKPD